MKTFRFSHLFILTLGLCASTGAFAQDASVMARVGDIELRSDEIRSMIDKLEPREQAAISRDPALLNQSVRQLLISRLVLKEAIAKQWDKEAGTAAAIEQARNAVIVESYLQSLSKVDDAFPSEAELKAAYESNKASLQIPRQFKISQIYVATLQTAEPAVIEKAKARLETIRKSLRQPNADFSVLARTQSDAKESAKSDGELGWIAESQLQPEIRTEVVKLAKNGVSEPVRMSDGWHIIKCLDVREARTASFDEARARLAQQLRAERVRAARQTYLAGLVKENPLSVNEMALSKVINKADK